jgi:hypothetical protein
MAIKNLRVTSAEIERADNARASLGAIYLSTDIATMAIRRVLRAGGVGALTAAALWTGLTAHGSAFDTPLRR